MMEHENDGLESRVVLSPWRGVDVLAVTVFIVLVLILGIFSFKILIDMDYLPYLRDNEFKIWLSVGLAVLEGVILLTGVYFLGVRRKGLNWDAVGLQNTSVIWITRAILIGLLVIPLSGLIALAIQRLLGSPLQNPQLQFIAPGGFSWFGLISMVLLGGLFIPFAEEIYFRGLVFNWIRSRWGSWIGAFISSLIFGIVHGEISIAVAAFFMGIVLAWIFERSESIWPAVIIHAINNSFKIIFLYIILAMGILPPQI